MIKTQAIKTKALQDMSPQEKEAWEQREFRYDGVPEVSVNWLRQWFDSFRIVDIRQPQELHSPVGHIDDVEHIEMQELPVAAKEWDPNVPVILLCRTGTRTAHAANYLIQTGFPHVASVRGGMFDWIEQGFSVSYDTDNKS